MKHVEAIKAAVENSSLAEAPRYAPLIALCGVLAAQMDAAGTEPSTRLTAAYLSALKDLNRAINAAPAPPARNKLTQLRDLRPRPVPSKKAGNVS